MDACYVSTIQIVKKITLVGFEKCNNLLYSIRKKEP